MPESDLTPVFVPRTCPCPVPNEDCEHPSCPRHPEVQRIELEMFERKHR